MSIAPISTPEFSAKADLALEGPACMTFVGSADLRVVSVLDTTLHDLHRELLRNRRPEVVVDFRELEFMNSSCFKAFVTWLLKVQDLPPATQYKIVMWSTGKHHWQKRSLEALSCFAADLVQVIHFD